MSHGLSAWLPIMSDVSAIASRSIQERGIGVKKTRETSPANTEGVLSCTDAEEKIIINSRYPKQIVTIGKQLPEYFKEMLRNLLRTNTDVFAWTHADMTGIPKTITVNGKPFNTEHKLNAYSHIKPIKQKRRSLGPNLSTATRKEVEELTRAGILRKAVHQTWVANPVMVKKSDRGWRICVDFTDINKARPKDCYPLPEIDWKVESLSRFHLKCFPDAYKGYHQIQMAEEDEDKTTFFAGEGVYCYRKMPFGLKNAGATYQRLVDKVFNDQIGKTLEAYINDMVIKSTSEEVMLTDIKETFQRFRSINMKLNPKKCSFGVEKGPFLGHLITKQGIRANPSKVKAIANTEQPNTLKDIQSLNGKLTTLSRFLSKGVERSLPFFKVLKSCTDKKNIHFDRKHKCIFIRENGIHLLCKQSPTRSRAQLLRTGKLILALVHASRRLQGYFQAHTVAILTNSPIKQALTKPEKSGRVAK
ncbi:reverse transcriptase domain-containing protein [Tanacetum coccineum]|uniref:Reverse transcriptase domain-containing protein n=1 Tax=Tanacetum coccineum TaxID=301880 RepID=A0ABQ5C4X1_9ASTR